MTTKCFTREEKLAIAAEYHERKAAGETKLGRKLAEKFNTTQINISKWQLGRNLATSKQCDSVLHPKPPKKVRPPKPEPKPLLVLESF